MNKKYFWRVMTLMMVAMLSVGFASCGSDDDDDDNGGGGASGITESRIVGLWEVTAEEAYVTVGGQRTQVPVNYMLNDRIELKADHTCAVYDYLSPGNYEQDDTNRTWSLSGNTITMNINGHKVSQATVTELTASRLVWVNTEEEDGQKLELYQTMKKVN